eukprot:14758441-Heterocapsa_arctica.AAC.1
MPSTMVSEVQRCGARREIVEKERYRGELLCQAAAACSITMVVCQPDVGHAQLRSRCTDPMSRLRDQRVTD